MSLHFRMILSYRENSCRLLTVRIVFQIFFYSVTKRRWQQETSIQCIDIKQFSSRYYKFMSKKIMYSWVRVGRGQLYHPGYTDWQCEMLGPISVFGDCFLTAWSSLTILVPPDSKGAFTPITRRNYWRSRRIVCRVNPLVYRTAM